MLKKFTLFLFVSLLLIMSKSFADYPTTDTDFSMLPPFCRVKLKPRSDAETNSWSERLNVRGVGYGHVHHYCAALHSLRVANEILPINPSRAQDKRGLYSSVLGEVKYMEEHADPNFILFPNIYATKAEALFALDRPGEAAVYLTKAINKNRAFTKAYKMLADYYIKTGNKKSAIEILQEGIKYSKKPRGLQKRLDTLSK